jgi:hypothetical protein
MEFRLSDDVAEGAGYAWCASVEQSMIDLQSKLVEDLCEWQLVLKHGDCVNCSEARRSDVC